MIKMANGCVLLIIVLSHIIGHSQSWILNSKKTLFALHKITPLSSTFHSIVRSGDSSVVENNNSDELVDKTHKPPTSIWSPDKPLRKKEDFDFEDSVKSVCRIFEMLEPVIEKYKETMPLPAAVNRMRELLIQPEIFEEALNRRRAALQQTYVEGLSLSSNANPKKVEMTRAFLQGIIFNELTAIAKDKLTYILNTVLSSALIQNKKDNNRKNNETPANVLVHDNTNNNTELDTSSSSTRNTTQVAPELPFFLQQSSLAIDTCLEKLSNNGDLDKGLLNYVNSLVEKEATKCGVNAPPILPERKQFEDVTSGISNNEKRRRLKKNKQFLESMGMSSSLNEDHLFSASSPIPSPIAPSSGERLNDGISSSRNDGTDRGTNRPRSSATSEPSSSSSPGYGKESQLLKLLLILRNRIYIETTKQLHEPSSSSSSSSSQQSSPSYEDDGGPKSDTAAPTEKQYSYTNVKILARATSLLFDDVRKQYLETVLTNRKFTYQFMKFAEEGTSYLKQIYEKGKVLSFDSNDENERGGKNGERGEGMRNGNRRGGDIRKPDLGVMIDSVSKTDVTLPASRAFRFQQAKAIEKVAIQAREILQKFQ